MQNMIVNLIVVLKFSQSVITNDNGAGTLVTDPDNNWIESDNFITLLPGCTFCCGSAPSVPMLTAPSQVNTNQTFTISISGTLTMGFVWELYTAGCGVGLALQTTTGNNFTVTAPGTSSNVIYYVRSSEVLTCAASCATFTVCVVADIYAPCTECFANSNVCGPCFLPDPNPNPDLDPGCYEY